MSILISILLFSLIVIFHEFGHFLLARRAGIYVEEFALGMGPKIVSKKIGETVFCINVIPFGGYCKMMGEESPNFDDDRSYSVKTIGQRFLVVLAGPFFNFILAFIFAMIYLSISGTASRVVDRALEDKPAYEAGIRAGDKIVGINGRRVIVFSELQILLNAEKPEIASIDVMRDGKKMTFDVKPYMDENGVYKIGVAFTSVSLKNFFKLVGYSFMEIVYMIRLVYYSLGELILGHVSKDQIAGPVGLVSAISTGYNESKAYGFKQVIATLSFFIVLLSSNLGVMNLLPIPALDGGRLMFIAYEAITKKPIKPEYEGRIHLVGFVILMGLMVFISFNDIVNLFSK